MSYITEKITNAFCYNTIPVYAGSENVTKWFNEKAFINCNGLTTEQSIDKILTIYNDKD